MFITYLNERLKFFKNSSGMDKTNVEKQAIFIINNLIIIYNNINPDKNQYEILSDDA